MRLPRKEIFASVVAALAFGCSDSVRTERDPGVREAQRTIETMDVSRQTSAKAFHESVLKACAQIRMCDDVAMRPELLKRLASRVLSIDLLGRTYYGREQMLGNYWRPFTSIGLAMIEAGVPDAEILEFFANGWTKYRDMCLSAGDANDFGDGYGDQARRRRDAARCMLGHYENDVRFFERNALRYMLEGAKIDRIRQTEFLDGWHRAFGAKGSATGTRPVHGEIRKKGCESSVP